MDDSLKFQLIAEKIAEIKKSISALSAENLAEHNRRINEIMSVKKMQGEKGDKGDKGDRGEKGDKGEKGESGQDGKDAPYIVSSWIAADNHLMFELSDSTQIDCGSLASQESGGDTFITQKIVQGDSQTEQRQYVYINEQPNINYPAISYSLVSGTDYYRQSINVVV